MERRSIKFSRKMWRIFLVFIFTIGVRAELRLATFDVDVTPPVGSMMAYDRVTNHWDMSLRARGIVLMGAGLPIVLCSVDWIGIANGGHDAFCESLAKAAGTVPERVSVHTIHQHDAPECDFSAEAILKKEGLETGQYESGFQRQALADLAAAVVESLNVQQPITHVGMGSALVEKVASNRRIMGKDGKVRAVRYTACPDPELRAEPEGTIDPVVSLISFWNAEKPIAVLSFFATHPQSYYRTGIPNPDFPGIARFMRQLEVPSALHVHFNGAGGNVGAGKYNDGSPTNRLILAQRLADGMRRAWLDTKKEAIETEQVNWKSERVFIPAAAHLKKAELEAQMRGTNSTFVTRGDALKLAWMQRCAEGRRVQVSCLAISKARVLFLPGELFVEYQLGAKAQRPDLFVTMAAYGDLGLGYVGTAKAYGEGGYETSPGSANVGPEAELVLRGAISRLLEN